jgi:hypothetical protein
MTLRFALFFFLVLISLVGCYEDIQVTLKEPHVYKGKEDPHELDAAARAELLAERFKAVQLDR